MSEHRTEEPQQRGPKRHGTSIEKHYEGKRDGQAITVTVDGRPLNPRFDLRNHSPNEFEWGYGGSGPAQLALALLADFLSDDNLALSLYQEFKFKVVASLPHQGWKLTSVEIHSAIAELRTTQNSQTCSWLHDEDKRPPMGARIPVAVFRLGQIVATPNALQALTQDDILRGIQCHQAGNWGNLSEEDHEANDRAMTQGGRILSAYTAVNGTRFWIITEADRSVTTVLLPEDY